MCMSIDIDIDIDIGIDIDKGPIVAGNSLNVEPDLIATKNDRHRWNSLYKLRSL